MVYIVYDENPKPENYVAIFARKAVKRDEFRRKDMIRTFQSLEEAIAFANTLKLKYGVSHIRVFYEEGHSQTLRNSEKQN